MAVRSAFDAEFMKCEWPNVSTSCWSQSTATVQSSCHSVRIRISIVANRCKADTTDVYRNRIGDGVNISTSTIFDLLCMAHTNSQTGEGSYWEYNLTFKLR